MSLQESRFADGISCRLRREAAKESKNIQGRTKWDKYGNKCIENKSFQTKRHHIIKLDETILEQVRNYILPRHDHRKKWEK